MEPAMEPRRTVLLRVAGVLVAAVLVAVPVAADARTGKVKAPAAETAAALAGAMTARGLGCTPFVDADDAHASSVPGGPPAGDTGECPVNGATASLAVYDSPRELARALAAMPTLCRFVVAVRGPTRFTFVTARNWSVAFFAEEYDPGVGEALGGKTRRFDCTALARR